MTSLTPAVAAGLGPQRHPRAPVAAERGFSLPELLIVVTVIAILAGVAVGVTPTIIAFAKGESGVRQVAKVLATARESAITRRRNVQVRFLPPRTVEFVPISVGTEPPFTPETVELEGGVEYFRIDTLGDTPDGFGPDDEAIEINSAADEQIMFTSEGTFVDAVGDTVNVSVFFAINEQSNTATAVTIFGVTAVLRTWRWNGAEWVE